MIYIERKAARCLVICDCNTEKVIEAHELTRTRVGTVKSCGCLRRDTLNKTKHGFKKHRGYPIWHAMHSRCYTESNKDYHNYGGRGIIVEEIWNKSNPQGLKNFIEWFDKQDWQDGLLSIDRSNNDGNYSPDNCRPATAKEQIANSRPKRKRNEPS